MLLSLSNRLRNLSRGVAAPFVARISEECTLPVDERRRCALLSRNREINGLLPDGYLAYLFHESPPEAPLNSYQLPTALQYLADGDVVRIDPTRARLHALYRKSSPSNFLFVTERCDNYCVMCSQPPRDVQDDWLVDELREVVPLISRDTASLGITGGEPALLGSRLIELIALVRRHLPATALHVLSNGRAFSRREFAAALGAVQHPDLMIGIPLYSDLAEEHDYVVQARGAYDETIRGIINLKLARVPVELRVVLHRDTVPRLKEMAAFIARNLVFVDHVALMGLEVTGFARANLDALWIDPADYRAELTEAVTILHRARVPVSIYNHQLCVLPQPLHQFMKKSISDWKNMYLDECMLCDVRQDCGGFFASSTIRRSRAITPTRRVP